MDDEEKKEDDELKGEVLLPEVDDELPVEEDDDLLLHKHPKKTLDDLEGSDEDLSVDELAEIEDDEDEPYDDVDKW